MILVNVFLGLMFAIPAESLRLKTNWAKRVDLSEKIVQGQVVSVKSYWNLERTLIWTDVTVLIDEHIKGDGPSEITLTIPGGTVGNDTHWVSDTPQFNAGDSYVILLESSGQVAGGPDGVYLIREPTVGRNQLQTLTEDRFLSWVKAYVNGETKISFEEIAKEPSGMLMQLDVSPATISGVSPSTISAGTGDILTISGSGFGASRGSGSYPTICFEYDEFQWICNNSFIKSWSDTEIKVNVGTTIVSGDYGSPGSCDDTILFYNKAGDPEFTYPLTITFGYGQAKRAQSSASYYINETYGPTGTLSAIQSAAATWNGAGSSFSLNYAGETTRGMGYDGYNVIGFANLGSNILIARAFVNISGGIILESDIQFNTQFPFSTNPTVDELDLQSIAVHETGHWLYLLDLYGMNDSDKVMYGTSDLGEVKRDLAPGDRLGINWIYPKISSLAPDPMTWATPPYQTGTNSISMVATTATDSTSPIDYYFDFVSSPTGGLGGRDSGWQSGTSYTNANLQTNHKYGYRAKARAGLNNETQYSTPTQYTYTAIQPPTGITFGTVTATSIQVRSTNTPTGLGRGKSGLWIENTVDATNNSGWKRDNTLWTSKSLKANTSYTFQAKARNGDGIETGYGLSASRYTRASLPGKAPFSDVTRTSIRANWTTSNPSGTQYFCQNVTTGANSGWITDTSWNSDNLTCGLSYSFRVKARNQDGFETGWTSLGSQSSVKCVLLLKPNGGETIPSGSSYDIQWEATPEAVSFDLFYSLDNGASWPLLKKDERNTIYSWAPKPTGNKKACFVRVIGYNATRTKKIGSDTSDKPFTIEVVRLTSPNGPPSLKQGDNINITWTANETTQPITKVQLYYTKDGGTTYNSIITLSGAYPPGDYSQPWTVPPVGTTPKTKCKVKVVLKDQKGVIRGSDASDNFFTIEPLVPDMIETSVSDPPATAPVGSIISITDTAMNQGNAGAGASTTRYYLSVNTSKGTGDILLTGTRDVPALAAGESSTGTVNVVRIPSSVAAGTYYVLACADDLKKVPEGNETNNCIASSSSMQVTRPDLVETSVTNPPAAASVGSSFSATDTAQNKGKVDTGSSTTRYYLSADKIKGGGDTLLTGTRSLPALLPEATSTGTMDVTIPSGLAAGAYYLLACADDLKKVPEGNETNNCIASTSTVQIQRPDLIETSVTQPPATASVGSGFAVTDTAKNQGKADAGSSTTQYYLSADKIKGSGDTLLTGTRSVPALVSGATSTDTVDVIIPSGLAARAYYLLACADDMNVVAEGNETNNCIASTSTVQVRGPDLIETYMTNPPLSFRVGNPFSSTDTVENQGNVAAGDSVTRYYLSKDTVRDSGDVRLTGGRFVIGLAAGVSSIGSVEVTIPSGTAAGVYYLLACAGDMEDVAETNDKNNCIASVHTVQVNP